MTITRNIRACGAAAISAAFLLALAPASKAQTLNYSVSLNLSSAFAIKGDAPFSLDFDLARGSGNVTNSVQVTGITITGAGNSFASSPNVTQGSESGSVASGLALTNSSQNNEFAVALNLASAGLIRFTVSETTNSEVVGSGTAIPDQFNAYIDDNNTDSGFVPTNDPDSSNALVSSVINSGITLPSVGAYTSSSPDAGVTASVSAVPEPGSAALLLLGAVGFAGFRRTGRRA